jgi:septal ring factor EnvC (AmiA/AmiB activator)
MLNLFGLDLNKIIIYVIGVVIAIAVIAGVYIYWKHTIKKEAQLEFNNKQLEQVVRDQKQTLDQLLKINKDQEDIIAKLKKRNDDLKNQLTDLDMYLNSDQARKDNRPSSNVLKKTIQDIIGVKK